MPSPASAADVAELAPEALAAACGAAGLDALTDWGMLLSSWRKAARGKHGSAAVARFGHRLGEQLLLLREALVSESWRPGRYVHFTIREPKRRRISAAPFADRVVHHVLCRVIEPRFEAVFHPHSYANRLGRGTHAAVDRLQTLAASHPLVLRMDIVQHFPSIDHARLLALLHQRVHEPGLRRLMAHIVASGDDGGEHNTATRADAPLFPGDDLLALCRPRGLPIGNLTSQFWSNVYLHPLDNFVARSLGCTAYLRYVDDFALFGHSRAQLLDWRARLIHFLAQHLRLRVHEHAADVQPTAAGVPWLGFVVYPTRRRLKARKVVQTTRALQARYDAWRRGEISFAAFDASVQGWIAHAGHADTWALRGHVLQRFELAGGQWPG